MTHCTVTTHWHHRDTLAPSWHIDIIWKKIFLFRAMSYQISFAVQIQKYTWFFFIIILCISDLCRWRMIPSELDRLIEEQKAKGNIPFFVCATAGTTVMGAFDPINAIADVCDKHQLWLHIDVSIQYTIKPELDQDQQIRCEIYLHMKNNHQSAMATHKENNISSEWLKSGMRSQICLNTDINKIPIKTKKRSDHTSLKHISAQSLYPKSGWNKIVNWKWRPTHIMHKWNLASTKQY